MEQIVTLFEMYSPDELEKQASYFEYDNNLEDKPASEYNWEIVPELPLKVFLGKSAESGLDKLEDWVEWFKQENEMWTDPMSDEPEGKSRWAHLAQEEIQEPIIMVYNDVGEWHIWDGWHRTAASFVAGRKSVPAIVGTPK